MHSSKDAIQMGIGMIHQHFMLAGDLTVAENIALGMPPKGKFLWRASDLANRVEPLLDSLNMSMDLNAKVNTLTVGEKQRVEIIKTLYRGAKIIIMDEPTATLTPMEVEEFFNTIRMLTKQDYTVIFITHKIREVMRIADHVTALRMGETVRTARICDVTEQDIAHMMIGRDLRGLTRKEKRLGDAALEVENVDVLKSRKRKAVKDLSFSLRCGEILGIAGVEGNGQSELAEALNGIRPISRGSLKILGKTATHLTTGECLSLGVGYIPSDRIKEGLALRMSVMENLIVGVHRAKPVRKRGILNWATARACAEEIIEKFEIKTPDGSEPVGNLSGGNMQKTILGRELNRKPTLVIACQPTRGVDIGSTEHIHNLLMDVRDNGGAVLLISSELDEIMELSDRVMVMYEGESMGILNADEISESKLGSMMFGSHKEEAKE